jgi:hypothetical protein
MLANSHTDECGCFSFAMIPSAHAITSATVVTPFSKLMANASACLFCSSTIAIGETVVPL